MAVRSLLLALPILLISCLADELSKDASRLERRETCTVLANGIESVDDTPAINAAIKSCGDGGTIILPQDNIYSLHGQLNFQDCKRCDFQLEGLLKFATAQPYNYNTSFDLTGVRGATIRSLTGTGAINGNAQSWWWSRWVSDTKTVHNPDTFFTIDNASDITVSNLSIWDWKMRLFRLTKTSNSHFSNLNLRINGAWAVYPRNEAEIFAFELYEVDNISISSADMAYTPRAEHANGTVGACVVFDYGARNVSVENISCLGAWAGVVVLAPSVHNNFNGDPWVGTPHGIYDIYTRNLTSDAGNNTGIMMTHSMAEVKNVTWEDVTVLKGVPAVGQPCYLRLKIWIGGPWDCEKAPKSDWKGVWFKGFRGTKSHPLEGGVPGTEWGHIPESQNWRNGVDAHFVDWKVDG